MPNTTFRRWTADDIVKLKNFAQMQRGEIEQARGRAADVAKAGGTNDSERQQEAAQAQGR